MGVCVRNNNIDVCDRYPEKGKRRGRGGGASFPVINQQPFVFLLSSSFSAVVSDLAGDADILRTHEVFPAVFVWETSESACTFFVVE